MNKIVDVLFLIRPNSQFSVGDTFESLKWLDKEQTKPTKAEYDEGVKAYEAKEYQRSRASEYPSIEELVVALYDTDDKAAIEAKRAEVKKKYPKP
tara:strand:- start:201 stop:485 length:285 start_codon:yes stop_codon:yes gene_type:complete